MNIAAFDIGLKNSAVAIWLNGELVFFEKFSAENCKILKSNLESFKQLEKVDIVVIEQQMANNVKAIEIQGEVKMWFETRLPLVKVELFQSRLKYIGIDRLIYNTKYKRKKWAVEFAGRLIPKDLQDKFFSLEKKCDVADAIVIGSRKINKQ